MSEELQVQNVGIEVPGEAAGGTQQPTPQEGSYEALARDQGWKPKEEYEGDPEKWRPAKEFVERGEFFNKIEHLGKELKESKKAIKLLQEHNSKLKETEYKRAVDELKALQKKHMEEGNSDGYLEATDLLTDLRAEQKAREQIEQHLPQQPDPRFVSWVQDNSWYAKDAKMRAYADNVGAGYAALHPNIDPEEVLVYVTQEVKERFKDRFVNPNRTKPSPVEGGGSNSPGKRGDKFELTDEERKIKNTFIRTGALTEAEYIEQVKRMRGA